MTSPILTFLWVFIGGGLGASLRYGVTLFGQIWQSGNTQIWPLATLFCNLLGSLLIGLIAGFFLSRDPSSPMRLFLLTGLLGGFTTFSAFSMEMLTMLQAGAGLKAASYAVISVLGGLALAFLGYGITGRLPT